MRRDKFLRRGLNMKLDALLALAKAKCNNDDPAHDFVHILRVRRMCEVISKSEGANLRTIIPAAILHDVVNLPKDSPDRFEASQMAADESRLILEQAGFELSEIYEIRDI